MGGGASSVTVTDGPTTVWKDGKAVACQSCGVLAAVIDGGAAALTVGSGTYAFVAK